jgi:predicted secreted acid phosphatase
VARIAPETAGRFHIRMHQLRVRSAAAAVALSLSLWAGCGTAPSARPSREPLNLSTAKEAVIAYHESGAYAEDLALVAVEAERWLASRAARRQPGERLAVVFDIDETVLSNYPHMVSRDFGYVPEVWVEWVNRAEAPALPAVREVYRTARRLGLDVVFLTGRKDPRERPGTEANLAREGLGEYTRLILAAPDDPRPTAAERKSAARAALEAEGFRVIASIGDQASDLAGGHAERTFKLPNPFYLVP